MADEKIDVNVLIEEWHREPVAVTLHEYLGMTIEQYKRWVETGDLPSGSNLYDSTRGTPGAREADRRLRTKARRRALNRLAGRYRNDYLRILNEEVNTLRSKSNVE